VTSKSNLYSKTGLSFSDFEKEIDGKQVKLFLLTNKNGMEAAISNFGLRIVSLMVPDITEKYKDVVLGHRTIDEYLYPENEYYLGAIVGRYANRIANGTFSLEGQEYVLEKNNGENHLHGGTQAFHNVVWDANLITDNEIEFSYFSKHMDQGFPGNLRVTVNYKLTESNELAIGYRAVSDKTTLLNLTNHSYFNLAGEGSTIEMDHKFMINADHFTPIHQDAIPTGQITSVKNTPFDFTTPKTLKNDIQLDDIQLKYGNGYDHIKLQWKCIRINQECNCIPLIIWENLQKEKMGYYMAEELPFVWKHSVFLIHLIKNIFPVQPYLPMKLIKLKRFINLV